MNQKKINKDRNSNIKKTTKERNRDSAKKSRERKKYNLKRLEDIYFKFKKLKEEVI